MNNAQGECSNVAKRWRKKEQPHEELLFNYYDGNCQMQSQKLSEKCAFTNQFAIASSFMQLYH